MSDCNCKWESYQIGIIPSEKKNIKSYKDLGEIVKIKIVKNQKIEIKMTKDELKIYRFVSASQFIIGKEISTNYSKYSDFIYNQDKSHLLMNCIQSMIWRDYEKERINNHLKEFVKNDFELTEENMEYVLKTFNSYLEDLK